MWIFHGLFDELADVREMILDVAVRQAQDAEVFLFEIFRAAFAAFIGLRAIMRVAVELEDEPRFVADEIHDVRPDGFLPLELPRAAAREVVPKMPLRRRHVMTKLRGTIKKKRGVAVAGGVHK